jgi:hypothetical protein
MSTAEDCCSLGDYVAFGNILKDLLKIAGCLVILENINANGQNIICGRFAE